MKKFLKWVGILFLVAIVVKSFKAPPDGAPHLNAPTLAVKSEVVPTKPDVPLPDQQLKFIQIVKKAQDANMVAANDMQKGGARAIREKELCSILNSTFVTGWVGDVYNITSNSDGKGVLEIAIGPNIYVKTWNNALSDMFHHTLIEPGTRAFENASRLSAGQKVKFSGFFFGDSGDSVACLSEGSLTLDGKLSEPEFIFLFSDIDPL